ncbi:MAG: TIGR03032 family protein [Anaerolineae bacterium]
MDSIPEEQPDFEVTVSRHFPTWLAEQQISLAFAIPPAKLFFVGLYPDGSLSIYERTFNKTMGLARVGTDTIYVGTRYQIWKLESPLPPGQRVEESYDRLYIPRKVYRIGNVNVHDVAVDGAGRVLFVNTRFGCVCAASDQYSFVPVWKPPFLAEITQPDHCHLNGLAIRDGKPAYVTSVSTTDTIDGWRDHRRAGGVVVDMASNEIVATGLSMPHSPRLYRDELWVTNSGTGQLGKIDLARGQMEPVAFAPGFLRGLDFYGDYAIVGSSKPRHGDMYSGLGLDDELSKRNSKPHLGLFIINLRTGAISDWLFVEGPARELFDVVVLPGVRQPMALGLITDEIKSSLWFDAEAYARQEQGEHA